MTVIDVADATEIRQAVSPSSTPGPVYFRLEAWRDPCHLRRRTRVPLTQAQVLVDGDVALLANGMMLSAALRASQVLHQAGVSAAVSTSLSSPIDATTVLDVASRPGRW